MDKVIIVLLIMIGLGVYYIHITSSPTSSVEQQQSTTIPDVDTEITVINPIEDVQPIVEDPPLILEPPLDDPVIIGPGTTTNPGFLEDERPDHRCGINFGGAKCGSGRCCSTSSWCGWSTQQGYCGGQVAYDGPPLEEPIVLELVANEQL